MRCAVYARVSVADTQSRELSSIDLQVEACQRYIESQRSLGWTTAGPAYTDDGISGATLKRPGLRAMLDDMQQDKIDMVVVHRLDRLTRSLFDLSDLIPLFTIQRVGLFSVSHQVDICSASGRLLLNLATTFAEYERENIGDRTRDKLSATRAKGLWQGSGIPLGYGVDFKQRLLVLKPEAEMVQDIFRHYMAHASMTDLMDWLHQVGVKTKRWVTHSGKPRGGRLMDRTTLYRLLKNRMYIGEALLNGEWHSRIYPPIVDMDLWSQVQKKLAQRARRKGVSSETRSPLEFSLIGKLFWHDGRIYKFFKSAPHGKKHYLYYLAPSTPEDKASGSGPVNLSTNEIHQLVIRDLRAHFKNPVAWLPALLERTRDDAGLDETMIRDSLKQLDQAWDMYTDSVQSHTVFRLVSRVTIYPNQVGIQMDVTALIEFILDLKQICARQQEKA
jgi:DNA invertase Pin-like site-specific DNA recombinase